MESEAPRDVSTVSLVEANANPLGVQLVNTQRTNKNADANDLVALAIQVCDIVIMMVCVPVLINAIQRDWHKE